MFNNQYTTKKSVLAALKTWATTIARSKFDLKNVTINVYTTGKKRIYIPTHGCYNSGADEHLNAYQAVYRR